MSEVQGLSSRTLAIGALRVAIQESRGSGPAVLLVHGNSSSSRIWQRTLAGPLAGGCRLVTIDLPGHGQSGDAGEGDRATAYSIPGYAGVIREVVRQLALERAVMVGWSLGGHAVLEASPELPDAAGFMVFGAPPLPFPLPPDLGGAFLKLGLGFQAEWTPEQAREYVADFMVEGADAPDFALEDALRTDGHARSSLAISLGSIGYRDEAMLVKTLAQPLAILQGARERIVAPGYLDALAPSIPELWRGQVQVVQDAGHALQWEQPAEFDGLLHAFVQDCNRPA
jgi:pimeloyl-ACP methyl ester carboxylesterase